MPVCCVKAQYRLCISVLLLQFRVIVNSLYFFLVYSPQILIVLNNRK